jgi:hypothetical protein
MRIDSNDALPKVYDEKMARWVRFRIIMSGMPRARPTARDGFVRAVLALEIMIWRLPF